MCFSTSAFKTKKLLYFKAELIASFKSETNLEVVI